MPRVNTYVFLLLLALVCFIPQKSQAACQFCPPLYCENPDAARQALERKKNFARSRGLPERLVALFDRLPMCLGCIEKAPDWVHITWRIDADKFEEDRGYPPNYEIRSMPWSADTEKKVRDDMRRGVVTEFHILHYGGAPCKCCPDTSNSAVRGWQGEQEAQGDDIPGYNEELDFHPDVAISFTNPRRLGSDPADLTEIPPQLRRPTELTAPPLEEFMDPAVRVVHVICRACEGLADEYNAIGDRINGMRREIAVMRRDLYYDRELISWVWRELDGINAAAVTPETDKKRKDLYEELGNHQRAFDRHKRRLQEKLELRAELEIQLADLLQRLKDCEETGCQPQKNSCAVPESAHKAIAVGANDEVGSGAAMKDKIKGQAKGMAMGALNGVLGGSGLSLGGGGDKSKGPKTQKDPTRKAKYVSVSAGDTEVGLRAALTKEGLVVSAKIMDSPGDGTFHAMWLEDGNGNRYLPVRYDIYELYRDWKLTVWWTHDHYVNGQRVLHEEGKEVTVGRDEAVFAKRFEGQAGMANSIWSILGFNNASKGVKAVGAVFNVPQDVLASGCPLVLVTHVTLPKGDPVVTKPVLSTLKLDQDGRGVTVQAAAATK